MARVRAVLAVGAVLGLLAAGCGGDDDDAQADPAPASSADDGSGDDAGSDDDAGASDASADSASGDDDGDGAAAPGGGDAGSLVIGDETIEFDSARCFLEEQDAAAGGGKILFVAQAFGTNAAGDELVLDVSRYDEDSQFAGDDIIVDIGDPFSDEAVSLKAVGEIGTVTVDGTTLSASGLTFNNFDDFEDERQGSFQINC